MMGSVLGSDDSARWPDLTWSWCRVSDPCGGRRWQSIFGGHGSVAQGTWSVIWRECWRPPDLASGVNLLVIVVVGLS
jgi:hypothetical protein